VEDCFPLAKLGAWGKNRIAMKTFSVARCELCDEAIFNFQDKSRLFYKGIRYNKTLGDCFVGQNSEIMKKL